MASGAVPETIPENEVQVLDGRVRLWEATRDTPWRAPRNDAVTSLVRAGQLAVGFAGVGILVPLVVGRRRRWARPVRDLAASPYATALVPAGFALTVAGLHGVIDVPTPSTPDEFSNLLLADTLLHGRLANPTTALWEHFETIAVLVHPVYASKYPPGHGMMLAFGQLWGHPWLGVWMECGLAAAAVALAVRRWLGPRLAMFAGLGFAFHPSIMAFESYWHGQVNYSWAHGYFGGALPTAGGALLVGAVGRREKPLRWLLAFALGLAILAFTRPFEGLLVAVPCTVMLLDQLRRTGALVRGLQVLLPLGGLLLIALGGYNTALTGSPTGFPHREYARQYSAAAMFIFQEPQPFPTYSNERIEKFYKRYQRRRFESAWSLESRQEQVANVVGYYLWPGALGFCGLVLVRRRRLWGPVVMVGLCTTSGLFMMEWHPHYLAPAASALFLLAMAGLGRLERPWWAVVALGPLLFPLTHEPSVGRRWPEQRQVLDQILNLTEGEHLVLVDTRSPFKRWVQNGADLEGAKVIWAHALDDDSAILEAYEGRAVWRLDADRRRPTAVLIDAGYLPDEVDEQE